MTRADRPWWVVPALICALALALRLWALGAPLWYDEILTLVRFVRLPTGELLTTYTSLNNHMFYSLQAQLSVALFGESAFAMRLPAALMGVASVAALWALANRCAGRFAAHLSSLLLALSYHHVWFSQNARGYTGLLFWSLLSTWIVARIYGEARDDDAATATPLDPQRARQLWLLYAVAVALSGYTHLSAALFFLAHALVLAPLAWLRSRRGEGSVLQELAGPLIGLGGGALLTVALHAPLIPQMVDAFGQVAATSAPEVAKPVATGTGDVAKWNNPLWTVMEIVRGFGALGPLLLVALPGALVLLGLGGRGLWRRSPIVTAIYALHVPLTLVLLLAAGMRIWPRYFFADIGFILLCVAFGVVQLAQGLSAWAARRRSLDDPTRARLAQRLQLAMAALGVLGSLALLPKNYLHPKQDFEAALAWLSATRTPSDAVAVVGLAATPYREYYDAGFVEVEDAAALQALLRQRPAGGAVYLVYSFGGHTKSKYPDVVAVLERDFERVQTFPGTLGDGSVRVFRSVRHTASADPTGGAR